MSIKENTASIGIDVLGKFRRLATITVRDVDLFQETEVAGLRQPAHSLQAPPSHTYDSGWDLLEESANIKAMVLVILEECSEGFGNNKQK